MTAGRQQARPQRRVRRLIERPRLIKLLDETEARAILLVAPAGYGKTTLARQWARTLTGTIWISSTPSHRDVAVFAEDVAAGIDALGGSASRFIGEYVRAQANPQRAARQIAGVLATRVEDAGAQWLIIDDYQELAESPEAEEMVVIFRERIGARLLVASRTRPRWATTRDVVYGEIAEIGPAELALTPEETTQVLGRRPDLEPIVEQAQGWPAVVALAAGLDTHEQHEGTVPTTLHRYVAEELFQSASPELRDHLISLALLPSLDPETLSEQFGSEIERVIEPARDLGFVSGDERIELHPLLREFLLAKLAEQSGALTRVRAAVESALAAEAWTAGFDLILRFSLVDLVDPALNRAFNPLVRGGHLGLLSTFATRIRESPGFPTPEVDVVEAELALHDGHIGLAAELAARARKRLAPNHALRSRAGIVAGKARYFDARFQEAADAYVEARNDAQDQLDEIESIFGLVTVQIFGEEGDPGPAIAELAAKRLESPEHLLRHLTAVLSFSRLHALIDLPIDEGLHILPAVLDPRVRSAFTYQTAYILATQANYTHARTFLALFARDASDFNLEFAQPFLDWTTAFIELGDRRFGEADRYLQRVEDAVARDHHESHELNARILRARLLLQTGVTDDAIVLLQARPHTAVLPSWEAELLATRALALACKGSRDAANELADQASESSRFVEIGVLAQAARAVTDTTKSRQELHRLFSLADSTGVWDPVVCALRASHALLEAAAESTELRPQLEHLLRRCGDVVLARQAGVRTRATRSTDDLLSPREREVLGLMAQGFRNREIASALYIAESTVKVHARHILEKLGVRTRAEAVARFERSAGLG